MQSVHCTRVQNLLCCISNHSSIIHDIVKFTINQQTKNVNPENVVSCVLVIFFRLVVFEAVSPSHWCFFGQGGSAPRSGAYNSKGQKANAPRSGGIFENSRFQRGSWTPTFGKSLETKSPMYLREGPRCSPEPRKSFSSSNSIVSGAGYGELISRIPSEQPPLLYSNLAGSLDRLLARSSLFYSDLEQGGEGVLAWNSIDLPNICEDIRHSLDLHVSLRSCLVPLWAYLAYVHRAGLFLNML